MPPRKRATPKNQCKLICCTTPPEALEVIRADVARWEAGGWARENNYGPACTCGLKMAKGECHRHGTRERSD